MSAGGRAPQPADYRPGIDGLRAIAVIAVIFYHAGFGWMPGGFLGVDIFFVISGYLITKIIRDELGAGNFSLWRFYERRIRRIVPALLLVMLLCVPIAWWLMLPDDLENFGQSLAATALFANNVLVAISSGYFEQEAAFKPLIHSWSLGVEEQYYLIVPLAMLAAWRLGKARGLWVAILAVSMLSFALCLWAARTLPVLNFLVLPSRGWELGVGALALLAEPRLRRIPSAAHAPLAAVGLAMTIAPLFVFDAAMPLPGLPSLIPVAGTALMLVFAGQSGPVARLLSMRPLVSLGLISYSLYLFHQPVFAFARIASLAPPPQWLMAGLIAPILLLASLSWRFVETPFRDRTRIGTRALLLSTSGATLLALGIGVTLHLNSGFVRNWPELADRDTGALRGANIAYNMGAQRFAMAKLPETPGRQPRVLVIGDSFARDFINMGLETGNLDASALRLTNIGPCSASLPPRLRRMLDRADMVVLSWQFEREQVACVPRLVSLVRRAGVAQVVVIGTKSFGWNNNAVMRIDPARRYAVRVRPMPEAVAINEALRRSLPGDVYVDLLGMIGDAQGTVPVFTPDRRFISQDRRHLTRAGAAYVGAIVFDAPAFRKQPPAGQ